MPGTLASIAFWTAHSGPLTCEFDAMGVGLKMPHDVYIVVLGGRSPLPLTGCLSLVVKSENGHASSFHDQPRMTVI